MLHCGASVQVQLSLHALANAAAAAVKNANKPVANAKGGSSSVQDSSAIDSAVDSAGPKGSGKAETNRVWTGEGVRDQKPKVNANEVLVQKNAVLQNYTKKLKGVMERLADPSIS